MVSVLVSDLGVKSRDGTKHLLFYLNSIFNEALYKRVVAHIKNSNETWKQATHS